MKEIEIADLSENGKRKMASNFGISFAEFQNLYMLGYTTLDQIEEYLKKKFIKNRSASEKNKKYSENKSRFNYKPKHSSFSPSYMYELKQFSCCTIATHLGTKVRRPHNIRDPKVVNSQTHIDKNGIHETWIDESLKDAYHRIFDRYVEHYNASQKRKDRMIKDYLKDMEKKAQRHPVYEMVIGVYGRKFNGEKLCSDELGKQIMREFIDDWKHRNRNLELIGAYYHADEQGDPHVHLDFVPVAYGYTNGMYAQAGFRKALEQMGFKTDNAKMTAQIKWEKRENYTLEKLCKKHGIDVWHPNEDLKKHLETEEFKMLKEYQKKAERNEILDIDLKARQDEIENMDDYLKFAAEKKKRETIL